MDEFGLVWLSSVWFDEVDFLEFSRSARQLSFTNLLAQNEKIWFGSVNIWLSVVWFGRD